MKLDSEIFINKSIFWFRRDLRLHDNHGLYQALTSGRPVIPIFIFDQQLLSDLDREDRRLAFIHKRVDILKKQIEKLGSSLLVFYGHPAEVFKKFDNIRFVFTNKDYEPYAIKRDKNVEQIINDRGGEFLTFKDHVIYEQDDILKKNGTPYTIFGAYNKKWKKKFYEENPQGYPSEKYLNHFNKIQVWSMPKLVEMGFTAKVEDNPDHNYKHINIRNYSNTRDIPAIKTSRLGVHLRFGILSIREIAHWAKEIDETFLTQLTWRDFYIMILYHFPRVVEGSFKPVYDNIEWENNEEFFYRWCQGNTGYPLVDAGMAQLNKTGYMHNRVRMICASFLCKHLCIDWRWGEAYFAEKLMDYELASNNGNWQWVAGCGSSSAPYFRVFNPSVQQQKFDPDLQYIKQWLPGYNPGRYTNPMVDHSLAVNKALAMYEKGLEKQNRLSIVN